MIQDYFTLAGRHEGIEEVLTICRRMPYKRAMAGVFDKAKVSLREVEVRPARADERRRWDALMAAHHYLHLLGRRLGFRQFAGCGTGRCGEGAGGLAVGGLQMRTSTS